MNRLRELREQAGLSLHELAERSDIDQGLLREMEDGEVKASAPTVSKLTDALNAALFDKGTQVSIEDFNSLLDSQAGSSSIPAVPTDNAVAASDGVYDRAVAAVRNPASLQASADGGAIPSAKGAAAQPGKAIPPSGPSTVAPGVVTKAPGYLSYQTKQEAGRAKLMLKLMQIGVPALIIGGIFAWIGVRLWQQYQDEVNPQAQLKNDVLI